MFIQKWFRSFLIPVALASFPLLGDELPFNIEHKFAFEVWKILRKARIDELPLNRSLGGYCKFKDPQNGRLYYRSGFFISRVLENGQVFFNHLTVKDARRILSSGVPDIFGFISLINEGINYGRDFERRWDAFKDMISPDYDPEMTLGKLPRVSGPIPRLVGPQLFDGLAVVLYVDLAGGWVAMREFAWLDGNHLMSIKRHFKVTAETKLSDLKKFAGKALDDPSQEMLTEICGWYR